MLDSSGCADGSHGAFQSQHERYTHPHLPPTASLAEKTGGPQRQELCYRGLVSSQKTVPAETNEGANKDINTQPEMKNICLPQEFPSSSQASSNRCYSVSLPLQAPERPCQFPNSNSA